MVGRDGHGEVGAHQRLASSRHHTILRTTIQSQRIEMKIKQSPNHPSSRQKNFGCKPAEVVARGAHSRAEREDGVGRQALDSQDELLGHGYFKVGDGGRENGGATKPRLFGAKCDGACPQVVIS